MRIVEIGRPLELAELPVPVPGPGEVLIRVRACGINFADTLLAAGRYQEKPALPCAPGLEVCGVVEAAGAGAEPALGLRVAAYVGVGGLAEYLVAPASRCVPVPEAMPDEEAAGFPVAYGTSHLALAWLARLAPGETLLVTGAAGGVGLTAVEIGGLLGARVIAVARGAERLAVARAAGAAHLVDAGADLRAEVKALGGADVVYDTVGGAAFEAALRAARPGARLLPIGFASGEVPRIPANILLVKNLAVLGFTLGHYAAAPEVMRASFETLLAWYGQGRLRPHVGHVLPLEAADEALDLLRGRRATGKVVVRVADYSAARHSATPLAWRSSTASRPASAARAPVVTYMLMQCGGSSGSAPLWRITSECAGTPLVICTLTARSAETLASTACGEIESTASSQGMPAASSASIVGRLNTQCAQEPKRSGRDRQARPPGAPVQTSGSRASVSPPSSTAASVVRIRSSSPRAKRSLSPKV
jgi:NADPH2:quinone reductase